MAAAGAADVICISLVALERMAAAGVPCCTSLLSGVRDDVAVALAVLSLLLARFAWDVWPFIIGLAIIGPLLGCCGGLSAVAWGCAATASAKLLGLASS